MLEETASANRRRHERAGIQGRAIVEGPRGMARGEIVNIGAGGVLVRDGGEAVVSPGTMVSVRLVLDRLVRVLARGGVRGRDADTLAIEFASPWPAVIVLDPSAPRRRRIADALRDAGCCSLEASSPLEVVDLLERINGAIAAVVVAESTRSQTGTDEPVG